MTKDISMKKLQHRADEFAENNYKDHKKVNVREKQKGFLGQFLRYYEDHRND